MHTTVVTKELIKNLNCIFWHMLAKIVFKPQLFFHPTFKVAVPDPKLNLKIGSAFSRVNEIKSTGPLHSDPKFKISFGYCC